jgi:lipopolysaccharide/colanic/teichoic acid biosynthesis glycosyltransferase
MTTRRLALGALYLGALGAVLGASKLHAVRHEYDLTGSSRFGWALAYAALLGLVAYALGLPDAARGRGRVLVAFASAAGAAVAISVVQLAVGVAVLPRFVVFGAALALVAWYWAIGLVLESSHDRSERRDRVVFAGTAADAAMLADDLELAPERPARLLASAQPVEVRARRAGEEPLVDLVIAHDATVLVLGRDAHDDQGVVVQASALHEAGVRVRTLCAFYEQWLGKLPIADLERMSLMFDIKELHQVRYGRVKRLLDIAVALPGCVLLGLALPVVWFGNAIANRGPTFYTQVRVGRHGRPFRILKFRTMRPVDGGLANEWTTEDDPRITRFGGVLRRTHLDELPQVLNILRGHLSIVGPRPEQPQYVEELAQKLPFYPLRHLVRPGLTGWAQVKYGYAGNERDALEKLQYEFFYLGHQSLGFDLRIIGRTIRSITRPDGR